MNATLRIVVLAVLTLSLGLAFRATRQIMRDEAALAAFAMQQIEWSEKIARLENRLRAATNGVVPSGQTRAPADEERGAVAGATASGEGPAMSTAQRLSANSVIANDPRQMTEFAKNFREGLAYSCGGMFKALGLSPEQIEKAKDLIVAEQQSWMDMRAAAEMGGLGREAYEVLKEKQTAIRMEKQTELLGPLAERFREYYHFTAPVRDLAQRLASTGAYPETSVTSAQVERVAEILAANSQRTTTGPWRGNVEPGTINWEAARGELERVLSPVQVGTLGLFVQNEAAQAKVTQQIDRLTAQFKSQTAAR